MSHHYSGVDFGFPRGDARLDFCDLYAFPKPGDTDRSILIMDVHPSKALPEGATTPEPFAPEAIYDLRIDTDGDLLADITWVPVLAVGGWGANGDGALRGGRRWRRRGGRRGSDHRGCPGVAGPRSFGVAGGRVPLLRWLA